MHTEACSRDGVESPDLPSTCYRHAILVCQLCPVSSGPCATCRSYLGPPLPLAYHTAKLSLLPAFTSQRITLLPWGEALFWIPSRARSQKSHLCGNLASLSRTGLLRAVLGNLSLCEVVEMPGLCLWWGGIGNKRQPCPCFLHELGLPSHARSRLPVSHLLRR